VLIKVAFSGSARSYHDPIAVGSLNEPSGSGRSSPAVIYTAWMEHDA
jgi:hypothetical protein